MKVHYLLRRGLLCTGIFFYIGCHFLSGCHRVFPFRSGDTDETTAKDASIVDSARIDALTIDATSSDSGGNDALKYDALNVDVLIMDDAIRDSGADLFVIPASCIGGAMPVHPLAWRWDMSICERSSGTMLNQCSAATVCNKAAGWHLCWPKEYQDRGGREPLDAAYQYAWIGGCIRSGGELHAPEPAICPGQCPIVAADPFVADWSCTSGDPGDSYDEQYIGIITDEDCRSIGLQDPANEAYWRGLKAHFFPHLKAVCCYRP